MIAPKMTAMPSCPRSLPIAIIGVTPANETPLTNGSRAPMLPEAEGLEQGGDAGGEEARPHQEGGLLGGEAHGGSHDHGRGHHARVHRGHVLQSAGEHLQWGEGLVDRMLAVGDLRVVPYRLLVGSCDCVVAKPGLCCHGGSSGRLHVGATRVSGRWCVGAGGAGRAADAAASVTGPAGAYVCVRARRAGCRGPRSGPRRPAKGRPPRPAVLGGAPERQAPAAICARRRASSRVERAMASSSTVVRWLFSTTGLAVDEGEGDRGRRAEDERGDRVGDGGVGERVQLPQHQVGELAGLQGADLVGAAEDLGAAVGAQAQRLTGVQGRSRGGRRGG